MICHQEKLRLYMKVVILCGGFGTRIRDVSDEIPKPMIPIGSDPILVHIMKHYYIMDLKILFMPRI